MKQTKRVIKIHQGKEFAIKTVQLEQDEAESLVYMCSLIAALLDRMEEMKGSVFYSKQVIDTLETFSKTKLKKMYSGEHGGYMADRVMHAEQVFREFVGSMIKLVEQPEKTKQIFNDEMVNAFIRAGVMPRNYEPMKIETE